MIGIFDSGSGGLTVLKALREVLPSADVVYFGDIKNAPYGIKSQEELSLLTVSALKVLRDNGADKIISACNSVSASLALSVLEALNLEFTSIVEMVGPTVSSLRDAEGHLLLCATPATIRAGLYQNAFRMVGKEISTLAFPNLGATIEFGKPAEDIENIIREGFRSAPEADVVVLACTHYPLVMDIFKKVVPDKIVIDPAVAVAERASKLFWPQEVRDGTTRFLISQDSAHFRSLVERLFPDTPAVIEVIE